MQEVEYFDNDETLEIPIDLPMGNMKCLLRDKNGHPLLLLGPHYLIFIIAWLFCTAAIVALLVASYATLTKFWFLMLSLTSLVFLLSYLHVGLSVPQIVRKRANNSAEELSSRFCTKCRVMKPPKAEHCSDCGVCIADWDHHCPWVGKCLGRGNIGAFYFFIFMTFANLIFCFVATAVSQINNPNVNK